MLLQSTFYISLDQNAEPGYDLFRIRLHILMNPFEHQANKSIFIEIRDKDLILFSDDHSLRTLFDHIHQQIIYDTIEILLDLLTADMSLDVQDEGLIIPDGIKDVQKSLLPGSIGLIPFDSLAGILFA